jgi:hypothetical protein
MKGLGEVRFPKELDLDHSGNVEERPAVSPIAPDDHGVAKFSLERLDGHIGAIGIVSRADPLESIDDLSDNNLSEPFPIVTPE